MLQEWPQWVTRLLKAGEAPGFWSELHDALRQVLSMDCMLVLAYHRNNQPTVLFARLSDCNRELLYSYHLSGGYLVGPYYQANCNGLPDGVYRIEEVAPEGFLHGEYYQYYYRVTGLVSELDFVSRVDDNTMVLVSCGSYRRDYAAQERLKCEFIAPLVNELARRRYQLDRVSGPQEHRSCNVHQGLRLAQVNFGRSRLSEREQEVVQLILRGHSIRSVAEKLGIAPGTVKVHRKNIYLKLDVCSQSDLFSLFLSALEASLEADAELDRDPLVTYWPVRA